MKKLLPVALLIALAAAWGFYSNQKKDVASTAETKKIEVVKEEIKPQTIPQNTAPQAVSFEQKAPQPATVSNDEHPPLPANPYEDFMKSVQPPQGSLEGINNKEISDDQIIRRNEYFEKLSQQLKELQGQQEAPPEQAPVETAEPLIQEQEIVEEPVLVPEIAEDYIEPEEFEEE